MAKTKAGKTGRRQPQQEPGFLIKDAVYVDENGTRHDPRGDYPGGWRNPGNVEPGAVAYPGEAGTVKAKSGRKFLKFKTAQDGLNAMGQSVGQMVRVKIPAQFKAGLLGSDKFTVENLVSVYAPSSDSNDTEDYIKFVSKKTGLDRAKELRLDDRATMASLLEAMVRRDSGHAHADWFRRDEYEAAAGRMGVAAETRQAAKGGNTPERVKTPEETYDTPIPDELRPAYDSWYGQLPKNLQYTGDYDLQGAWLERLGRPTKYEATQNGHLDDYGKKPNHPTFSSGSKWHDPKVPERTGGEWKKAEDGSWDFYPGAGNKLTDEQLKDYFDRYEKGNRVHPRNVRQAAKGGEASGGAPEGLAPDGGPAPQAGSPRIVINPTTFRNSKDALCVAFNEAFRIVMELTGFEPQSEPTEAQRRFFADTAYADDELQLRRTILARICSFDTSVDGRTAPTEGQTAEAAEFLGMVLERGFPQTEGEARAVESLRAALSQGLGPAGGEGAEAPQEPAGMSTEADEKGGGTLERMDTRTLATNVSARGSIENMDTRTLATNVSARGSIEQPERPEAPRPDGQPPQPAAGASTAAAPAVRAFGGMSLPGILSLSRGADEIGRFSLSRLTGGPVRPGEGGAGVDAEEESAYRSLVLDRGNGR